MSRHLQAAAFASSVRQQVSGDAAVNLRTKRRFIIEIDPQGYLVLAGALTKDLREKIKFYTLDAVAANEILPTDVLLILGIQWSVLPDSRVDNPASVQVSFECRKIITGKDT